MESRKKERKFVDGIYWAKFAWYVADHLEDLCVGEEYFCVCEAIVASWLAGEFDE